MRIEVSKNELAGALSALGKLVSRTSPVEAFRSVEIVGKENQITLRTANTDETIAFSIVAEVAEPFAVLVNFDDFRTAVRGCRNKSLTFMLEDGQFAIDGLTLRQVEDILPVVSEPGNDCISSPLPVGFVNLLATAAPLVDRNNYRKVLQGIHLGPEGVVVTNGKELLNIPADLKIVPLTLPFPLALLATKCEMDGTISTWTDQEYRYFRIEIGNWYWSGKALVGMYPVWKQVIPDAAKLNHVVALDEASAEQLATFLKNVPDNTPNNPITLSQSADGLKVVGEHGQETVITADFPVAWGDFSISLNKTILTRLLSEGHLRIAFGDEYAPFTATQGIGTYVAMPLAFHNKPNVHPNQQEEKEMNENTNVVAAPVQSVANNVNPDPIAAVNPLDDLAAAVDEFKGRIRLMFEEATNLTKKVKEVSIAQKQKERDFILAKRAIERIRMAI